MIEVYGDYLIRKARISDSKALSILKRNVWETTYRGIYSDSMFDNYDYEENERKFAKIVSDENVTLYVVEFENNLVGYIKFGKPYRPYKDYEQDIGLFYILKEHQGKGLGRQLFNIACDRIKSRGYKKFFISCNKYNIDAQKFYKKMGGKIVETDADNDVDYSMSQVYFEYVL